MQTTFVEQSHPEMPRPQRDAVINPIATDEEPELLQARLLLGSLIANPPKGSIPMRIDRPMATAMLERNQGNRGLRELAVKHLMGVMARDEWQHNGETLKFTICGNLNDGQHRLTAVKRSGGRSSPMSGSV